MLDWCGITIKLSRRGQTGRKPKGRNLKPSNQALSDKQRGTADTRKGRPGRWGSTVGRYSVGERNCRKLSTEIGRKAWKQAGRKRKSKEAARQKDSTEGTADRGKREEGKRKTEG